MKLSEMPTERAMDVLCELTPYINSILTDEELLEKIRENVKPKDVNNRGEMLALGASKINKIVPIIFKKRKEDVFGILGALNGKTVEEIGKQSILITAKQIMEIINDKDLIALFR